VFWSKGAVSTGPCFAGIAVAGRFILAKSRSGGGQQKGRYLDLILKEVRSRRTDNTVIHAIGVLDIRGRAFLGALTEESGGTLIESPSS